MTDFMGPPPAPVPLSVPLNVWDFEDGQQINWTLNNCWQVINSSVAHQGYNSLQLASLADGPFGMTSPPLPVPTDTYVEVLAWAESLATVTFQVRAQFLDGGGGPIPPTFETDVLEMIGVGEPEDWTFAQLQFPVPPGAASVALEITFGPDDLTQGHVAFVDDIVLADLEIVPPPPGIETATLPHAVLGRPYEYQVRASGGFPPYDWSVTAGQLPPGLSLDPATGIISGTPTP
jgi:hypothetical protein